MIMGKSRLYIIAIVVLSLLISGLALEIQASSKSSALISAVATVYGGPYAGLLGSFIKVLSKKKKRQEDGYASSQGGYYQQGNVPAGQDPYNQQGYYSQGTAPGGQDPYNQQGYYSQETAPGGQDPYNQQGYYSQKSAPAAQDPYYQQRSVPQERATRASDGGIAALPSNLEVSIDVLKEAKEYGKYTARPIKDGDTLTQQDNYKVQYQCNTECYVYIAQLDATGKLDPIVPSQFVSYKNPMTPNVLYSVPVDRNWLFLDDNKGIEQIYFMVSRTRRPDIEALFSQITNANKTIVQQAPFSMQSATVLSRGIGGMRKGKEQTVSFQNGSTGQYSSTLFSSIKTDLVMTRWFYHQ